MTCAKEYKLYGGPVSDLCNHNATVAESAGRQQVAQVWRVVGFIYSCSESRSQKSSHASCERRTSQRPLGTTLYYFDSFVSSEKSSLQNSAILLMELLRQAICCLAHVNIPLHASSTFSSLLHLTDF